MKRKIVEHTAFISGLLGIFFLGGAIDGETNIRTLSIPIGLLALAAILSACLLIERRIHEEMDRTISADDILYSESWRGSSRKRG